MSSTQKKLSWGVVLSAISLVAGMQFKACNAYAQNEHRISVVETKQTETEKQHAEEYRQLREDLRRMDDKLDRALERR